MERNSSMLLVPSSEIVHLGMYQSLYSESWKANEVGYYRIVSVRDPGNFVVANPSPSTWLDDMQRFYAEMSELLQVKTTRVFKNHLYAYKDYFTSVWHRVRVDGTNLWEGTAEVYLIDEGSVIQVDTNDLWDLEKRFWCCKPLVRKARLANICPPGQLSAWPVTSVEKFRELCNSCDLFCGISSGDNGIDGEVANLTLFNNDPEKISTVGAVSVQMYLVELGLAQEREQRTKCWKDYDEIPKTVFSRANSFLPFNNVSNQ